MGDSDDEFERRSRGRDKFRRERNDYERGGRDERRRESWDDRNRDSWSSRSRDSSRRDPYGRDYDRRRDRYSPARNDMSPPHMKRMRRDWDDGGNYGRGGYDMYQGGPSPSNHRGWGPGPDMPPPQHFGGGGPGQQRLPDVDYPVQPPVMSFKQFLQNQEDNISDEEAVKRFNQYKLDFQKQQISDFFLNHKDEEWFKIKYHPEECGKRKEELRETVNARLKIFNKLFESGRLEDLKLDISKSEEIVKILDSGVILLEGGTDKDLASLDMPEEPARTRTTSENQSASENKKEEKKPDEPAEPPADAAPKEEENKKEDGDKNGVEKAKKRKYSYSESGSDSDSGSDSEAEPVPPGVDEPPPPGTESKDSIPGIESKPEEIKEAETADEKEMDTQEEEEVKEDKPRPLHKTQSIFFRNLAPSITKLEVEGMCRQYPGFLRVAIQDPQPERRFFRRGWVTFDQTVNIKDICWNLSNIRLRDCEMGAIVNRELKQRVRPVSGITCHKPVMRADIQMAAKIIQNLDSKWQLWSDLGAEKKDSEKSLGFISKNPVMKNITDFLVDEGSFEEEELLGTSNEDGTKEGEVQVERDETLCKVLDRMIMYLRMVHSIDFYSGIEYPNEHEMPHRCGIVHARGPKAVSSVTQKEVNDYMKHIENKLKPMSETKSSLTDDEALPLGKKNPEEEVEKFITANTQELAKDKWLCPLSGKKFKGPDFVKKHLFSKHGEKIEDVKREVAFFNNFLMDPKRPLLPEHPAMKQTASSRESFNRGGGYQSGPPQQGMMGGYGPPSMGPQGGGGGGYNQGNQYRRSGPYQGGHDNYNRRPFNRSIASGNRSRPDPRSIVEYRDLDAPDDTDMF